VAQQQQFHLCGIDLLATPVDDVLDPALDADVPLAVDLTDRGQVAGAVEAVRSERPGVMRGRVEVSSPPVLPRGAAGRVVRNSPSPMPNSCPDHSPHRSSSSNRAGGTFVPDSTTWVTDAVAAANPASATAWK